MFYCQKCGKKNTEESQLCALCGTVQEVFEPETEFKACKRCNNQIPVRSNYCYYCGMDQAKILLSELKVEKKQPPEEQPADQTEQLPKIDLSDREKLQKFIKLAKKQGVTVHVLGKNESVTPGVIPGTKLFLRDWLNVNKRMGRADFWYGLIGSFCLSIPIGILIGLLAIFVQRIDPAGLMSTIKFGMAAWVAYFTVALFTALVRRYHDIELPGYLALLLLIPYCDMIALIIALLPQKRTNTKYTFEDPRRKNKKHH